MPKNTQTPKNDNNGSSDRPKRILAGKQLDFWKGIAENEKYQPILQSEPEPQLKIERMSRADLNMILLSLKDPRQVYEGEVTVAEHTFSVISPSLNELHVDDVTEILKVYFEYSLDSKNYTDALKCFFTLPSAHQTPELKEDIYFKIKHLLSFSAPKRSHAQAIEFIPAFSKEQQMELVGICLIRKYEPYSMKVIEMIPKLSEENQQELWGVAFEKTKDLLTSASENKYEPVLPPISTFPPVYQFLLIKHALRLRGDLYLRLIEFTHNLPKENQQELWKILSEKVQSAISASPDWEKAFDSIPLFPPGWQLKLIKQFFDSSFTRAKNIAAIKIIQSLYEENQPELWGIAFEKTKDLLNSEDKAVRGEAITLIPIFPKEFQPELVECALNSSYPQVCMAGVRCISLAPLEKQSALLALAFTNPEVAVRIEAAKLACTLPVEFQTPARYHASALAVKQALDSPYEALFIRAIEILRTLPKEFQAEEMWNIAFKKLKTALEFGHGVTFVKISDAAPAPYKEGILSPDYNVRVVLEHHKYWTWAVKLIPVFPEKSQEALWKSALKNAAAVFASGFACDEAFSLIGTFPFPYRLKLIEYAKKSAYEHIRNKAAAFAQNNLPSDGQAKTRTKKNILSDFLNKFKRSRVVRTVVRPSMRFNLLED